MLDRLPDPVDAASIQEAKFTDEAVANVQAKLAAQKHPDFNGVNCLDCGDLIPPLRLKSGRIRCTSCESLIEIKSKQYW